MMKLATEKHDDKSRLWTDHGGSYSFTPRKLFPLKGFQTPATARWWAMAVGWISSQKRKPVATRKSAQSGFTAPAWGRPDARFVGVGVTRCLCIVDLLGQECEQIVFNNIDAGLVSIWPILRSSFPVVDSGKFGGIKGMRLARRVSPLLSAEAAVCRVTSSVSGMAPMSGALITTMFLLRLRQFHDLLLFRLNRLGDGVPRCFAWSIAEPL